MASEFSRGSPEQPDLFLPLRDLNSGQLPSAATQIWDRIPGFGRACLKVQFAMDALFRHKAAFETSKPHEEITIEHLWTGNDLRTKPTATRGAPSAGKPRTIISMETTATRSKFSGTGCRRRGNRNNGREVGRFDVRRYCRKISDARPGKVGAGGGSRTHMRKNPRRIFMPSAAFAARTRRLGALTPGLRSGLSLHPPPESCGA